MPPFVVCGESLVSLKNGAARRNKILEAEISEPRMSLSNSTGPVLWDIDERGVAQVVLNRPEVNNAYDGGLVEGLLRATDALKDRAGLRLIVIKGNGRHFQAGADLKWIDAVAKSSRDENSALRAPPPKRCGGSIFRQCRRSLSSKAVASAAAPASSRPVTW